MPTWITYVVFCGFLTQNLKVEIRVNSFGAKVTFHCLFWFPNHVLFYTLIQHGQYKQLAQFVFCPPPLLLPFFPNYIN